MRVPDRLLITSVLLLASIMLAGAQAPTITVQPANINAGRGTSPRFQVSCTGTAPFAYQWLYDGVPLEGATNNPLVLSNVQPSQAGSYRVTITNSLGQTTSSIARLTVGSIAIWGPEANTVQSALPLEFTEAATISTGFRHMLAVNSSGMVVGWGTPLNSAVTNIPVSIGLTRSVSAGYEVSFALNQDGQLSKWGSSGSPTNVPNNVSNVVSISAAVTHALALRKDGTVVAWGSSGSATNVPPGLVNVVGVSASKNYSMAVTADGIVRAWSSTGPPAALTNGFTNAIAVASGIGHSVVLNRDGSVSAGGATASGQTNVPAGISNAVSVAAGFETSFAVTEDGKLWSWGRNIGTPTSLSNVVEIAAPAFSSSPTPSYAAALMNDGSPHITIHPVGQSGHAGDSTQIHVRAAGAGALCYQWLFNGSPLAGEPNRDLSFSPMQVQHGGFYQAVITNHLGSATSAVARLEVFGPRNIKVWGTSSANTSIPVPPIGITNAVAVSARYIHALSLNEQGQVALWGNPYGATGGVEVVTGAKAVAAGYTDSIVLKTNGTVVAWGGYYMITNLPSSLTNIVAISSGDYHALALNESGKVIGWGNPFGSVVPTNLTEVIAIAAGRDFSLALRKNGTVVGWGRIDGATFSIPPDVQNAVAISAGRSHALALLEDGHVVAWGSSASGNTNVPAAATNVIAIAAGQNHSLALKADGSLIAWGAAMDAAIIPPGLSNVIGIACSLTNSLAVIGSGAPVIMNPLLDNTIQAPGSLSLFANVAGQQPMSYQWFWNGVPIPGATERIFLAATMQYYDSGAYYFVASNEFGAVTSRLAQITVQPSTSVAAWGSGGSGQIDVPPDLTNIVKVSAGDAHSLALDKNGKITAWGDQLWDQCAIPATATNIIDIAAGYRFSAAVRNDGAVLVWGATNRQYRASVSGSVLKVPWNASPAKSLAAGDGHVVSLRRDGTVVAWGKTMLPVSPEGLTGVAAVAAGWDHSVALRSNGTVYCWGPVYENSVITNTPAGLSNVIAIAAGDYHTLALKADGTVVAWGVDAEITHVPEDLTNAVAIAAGYNRSMALTADGRLVSWGLPQLDPEDWADRSVPPGLTNVSSLSLGWLHNLAITTDPRVCITQSPKSRSVPLTWPVTLRSTASGEGNLGYQWQFNGADLLQATNSLLTITNVAESDYGNYRVIVSNFFGSVTSAVATVVKGNLLAWEIRPGLLGDPEERFCIPARASNAVAVAGGSAHTLALRPDGTVVGWGYLTAREAAVMREVQGARAIEAGETSGCAILSNGTLRVWSPYSPPQSASRAVSVSMDYRDRGAVCYDTGTAASWGTTDTNPPATFTNIALIEVVVSSRGVLGIRYDGSLATWGISLYKANLTNLVHMKFLQSFSPSMLDSGYGLYADGRILSLWGGGLVGTNCVSASGVRADGTLQAPMDSQPRPLTNVVEADRGANMNIVRFGDGSPSITIHPYSRIVEAWKPFTLTAFASGNPPLYYQWQSDGQDIPGATNASFTLNNPAVANVGAYRCIITNMLGSVTSEVAQVSLSFPPPMLLAQPWVGDPGGGFSLEIQKLSGQGPSIIYGSSDWVDWTALTTNPPTQGSLIWQDPLSMSITSRFYRVVEER